MVHRPLARRRRFLGFARPQRVTTVAAPQASRRVDMRITGYRTLTTSQDWGRPVGDVNGVFRDGVVEVGLLLLEPDEGFSGVSTGLVSDVARFFPAIEGEAPRATSA